MYQRERNEVRADREKANMKQAQLGHLNKFVWQSIG